LGKENRIKNTKCKSRPIRIERGIEMFWFEENEKRNNHPAMKNANKLTRENHEKVAIYDWALDLDLNPDWKTWQNEMNDYFGNSGWNR
jgi:hypothetical protein